MSFRSKSILGNIHPCSHCEWCELTKGCLVFERAAVFRGLPLQKSGGTANSNPTWFD
jgi:hypothetical protein